MKSPRLMYAYAVFLVVCGLVAYFMAPSGAGAGTALIVPSIAAALVVICAAMAGSLHRNRKLGMIGIHVGLVLPLLFAAAFAHRAYKAFGGGAGKHYLFVILVIMAVGSVIAFVGLLMTRPKPEQRGG